VPLANVGGKGLFVSEIEHALVDGRADLAVHSLKDLPADLASGLDIACVPKREDPRDVLVTRDGGELDDLHAGARVGTSSLRRVCQLRARRNDLAYLPLRGNVDTRLRKLDSNDLDAVVLAHAGLKRLGLVDRPMWIIPPTICIPAVGQGALAIEARKGDERVRELLAPLEDPTTRIEIEAERAFLARLQGGCQVPLAAYARVSDGGARVRLDGMVGSIDGERMLSASSDRYVTDTGLDAHRARAQELGEEVALALLAQGAERVIAEAKLAAAQTGLGGGVLH